MNQENIIYESPMFKLVFDNCGLYAELYTSVVDHFGNTYFEFSSSMSYKETKSVVEMARAIEILKEKNNAKETATTSPAV